MPKETLTLKGPENPRSEKKKKKIKPKRDGGRTGTKKQGRDYGSPSSRELGERE